MPSVRARPGAAELDALRRGLAALVEPPPSCLVGADVWIRCRTIAFAADPEQVRAVWTGAIGTVGAALLRRCLEYLVEKEYVAAAEAERDCFVYLP